MKVNVIFPFAPVASGGGLRVLFEYANRLSEFGHTVNIYYPASISYLERGYKSYLKFLYYKVINKNIPDWFKLEKKIKVIYIEKVSDKYITDGDIILSTWWSLMYDIKNLSPKKGIRFNLVQDIENWEGNNTQVMNSYTVANSKNVVIANYLYKYLTEQTGGKKPYQIPFAIDGSKYFIKNRIEDRDRYSVCMMYSTEPRKGSSFGLQALFELKKKYPLLNVTMFSVSNAPEGLPHWIKFYQNSPNLCDLYNKAAVFLGPSNQEGCALPPMEAMYCGCAVVCTNIDGHKDYAFNGETAIFAEPQNASDMAIKIGSLFDDENLRIKIALQGNTFIRKYDWDSSARKLESVFISELSDN